MILELGKEILTYLKECKFYDSMIFIPVYLILTTWHKLKLFITIGCLKWQINEGKIKSNIPQVHTEKICHWYLNCWIMVENSVTHSIARAQNKQIRIRDKGFLVSSR